MTNSWLPAFKAVEAYGDGLLHFYDVLVLKNLHHLTTYRRSYKLGLCDNFLNGFMAKWVYVAGPTDLLF